MKVLLILSDGMRPDAVEDHPVARYLKSHGTYCLRTRTVMPSVTLPCHMSLFHSVDPSRHGVTTNTYTPQVRPVPGLFDLLAGQKKKCAMFYNWEELRDLGRPGSLAESLFVSGHTYGYEAASRACAQRAKAVLQKGETDFAFLYLGWPDAEGHDHGWMGQEYLHAVDGCTDMVGELIEALGEEYVIFYTADHGGHGRSHGTPASEDMTIPLFCLGGPFAAGRELESCSILDIAPTIATLLGAEIPGEWEGRVIHS